MNRFPIEFQLLLLCSSYFSDKEAFSVFKDSNPIDWKLFLSLLHRHRVLPMVCHNLHRWGIELPIKHQLKLESLNHSKKALQQIAILLEVNKLFNNNAIECVHFKGVTLSHYLYQEPTLRQCRDIDLLIERKNIEKAYELLIKNGFSSRTPLFKKNYLNIRYQKIRKDYIFEKNNCEIELHWRLSDILSDKDTELFFKNKIPFSFHDQTLQFFDESHYLSYLILHGYYSGWARLHWLIDIVDFVKTRNIDWQAIKIILESTACYTALDEAIELIFLLFAIKKPAVVTTQAPKKNIRNAIRLMELPIKSVFLSRYDITLRQRENFLLQKGLIKKYKHFKMILATSPEDWRILPLPKPLFFLYYPLRPFLWFIRRIY